MARRTPIPPTLAALAVLLMCGPTPARAATVTGRVTTPAGEPVAGAIVFVRELPPGAAPPQSAPTAVMDQIGTEFVPRVLAIAVGTDVRFPNHDDIHHHVYSFSRAKRFEIPLYKGETPEPVRFDTAGVVKVGCNIHDWMSGVIVVLPTPYFTTTDANGAFALEVPAGPLALASWHELAATDVDATLQRLDAGDAPVQATFVLEVEPARRRLPNRGARVAR